MIDKLRISRKAWYFIHLALIAWVAWIFAGIAGRTAVGIISDKFERPAAGVERTYAAPPLQRARDYSVIVRQNIFNSALAAKYASGEIEEAPIGAPSVDVTPDAPRTTLDIKLVGTVLDTSGKYKMAAIESKSGGEQKLYRIGDKVEGATIVSVERYRVGLLHGGAVEILELDFTANGALAPGAGAGASAASFSRGRRSSGSARPSTPCRSNTWTPSSPTSTGCSRKCAPCPTSARKARPKGSRYSRSKRGLSSTRSAWKTTTWCNG